MDPQMIIVLIAAGGLIWIVGIIAVSAYIGIRRIPKKRAEMEDAIASTGYEGPAEIKRLLPADVKSQAKMRWRTIAAAFLLFSLLAGFAIAWLQEFVLIAGLGLAIPIAFSLIGVLCVVYSVVSLIDRFRAGDTLLDFGSNPWYPAMGTTRFGAGSMVFVGAFAIVMMMILGIESASMLPLALMLPLGLWALCSSSNSRVTEQGVFISGFLYSWESITWFSLTPRETWVLFGIHAPLTLGTLGQIHIPPGRCEEVLRLFEANAAGSCRPLSEIATTLKRNLSEAEGS